MLLSCCRVIYTNNASNVALIFYILGLSSISIFIVSDRHTLKILKCNVIQEIKISWPNSHKKIHDNFVRISEHMNYQTASRSNVSMVRFVYRVIVGIMRDVQINQGLHCLGFTASRVLDYVINSNYLQQDCEWLPINFLW